MYVRRLQMLRRSILSLVAILSACSSTGESPGLRDLRLGRDPGGDSLNRPPVLIRTKKPHYPKRLSDRLVEGFVVVEFRITDDGVVQDPTIIFSQPEGVFDQYATAAAEEWQYEPQLVDGEPTETTKRSLLTFCVDDAQFPRKWVRPKPCRSADDFRETWEMLRDTLP